MPNLLNLKKQPAPVIIEKIVLKKRSVFVETAKLITVIAVSSGIIWAVSNAQVDKSSKAQQPMQNRASQLENFLAHMPTELSTQDQTTLTTEITDAITTINSNNATSSFVFATSTPHAKMKNATSTLRAQNKNTTSTKLTKEARQQLASSTRASIKASMMSKQKTQQQARMKKSKGNTANILLVSAKIQAINQLLHPQQNNFVPKFASSSPFAQFALNFSIAPVSPDTLHQIVIANSTSTIQAVFKGIQSDRMKMRQEKIQEMMSKMKLAKHAKIATTTPEVATSTEEVATTTPTQTASVIDALPVATSSDTTASSTVASSTPDIASSTEVVASSTPEVASTTESIATTTEPIIAPVVDPVSAVETPAPVVEAPASESQP